MKRVEKRNGRCIPEKGDVLWLQFSPQAGHKQAGRRLAICLFSKSYNEKTGLGLFCPITSKQKGYPFEVSLLDEVKKSYLKSIILTQELADTILMNKKNVE